MKLKNIALLSLITVGVLGQADAATFRQSSGVGKFTANVTYENYDFDTEMKSTIGNSISVADFNRDYDTPLDRNSFVLRGAYGVFDFMDVFVGLGYVDEKWDAHPKDGLGARYEQTGKNPMFEIGFKGTLFDFMNDRLYVAYLAKYSFLESGEDFSGTIIPSASEAIWDEYLIDFELGYRVKSLKLTPYIGVSYVDITGKQNLDNYSGQDHYNSTFENEDEIGYFLGLNYEITDAISVNVEGVFGAKEGFILGLDYQF